MADLVSRVAILTAENELKDELIMEQQAEIKSLKAAASARNKPIKSPQQLKPKKISVKTVPISPSKKLVTSPKRVTSPNKRSALGNLGNLLPWSIVLRDNLAGSASMPARQKVEFAAYMKKYIFNAIGDRVNQCLIVNVKSGKDEIAIPEEMAEPFFNSWYKAELDTAKSVKAAKLVPKSASIATARKIVSKKSKKPLKKVATSISEEDD